MQNAVTLEQQSAGGYIARRHVLSGAVAQILELVLFCRHRQMSRPITHEGRTYRVCLSCGLTRDFDTSVWKCVGPYRNGR